MRLVFDIENDGFLLDTSRVHCMVFEDLDTGQVHKFEPDKVEQGVRMMMQADELIGHNIINHDLPVIQKVFPWFVYDEAKVTDTLVLSRLIFSNLSDLDYEAKSFKRPEGKLIGSHSLEAWGQRFGYPKVEHEDWTQFSPEMLTRCTGDVEITKRLWKVIQAKKVDPRASQLEHQVAFICAQQERHGFSFDEEKAQQLASALQQELAKLGQELQDTFPPFYLSAGVKTPTRTTNGKKQAGTWAGAPYTKIKLTVFNPGSRHHIANRLKKLRGWKPTEFTDNGQPKIDETILEKLPWPEAQLLNRYFLVQKRLGLLIGREEDKGWLNVVRSGKVHGSIITNGAVTGRGTHKVIANIPRVTTPYGMELRSLFCASKGRVQVGVDMSGIELRVFAHFLARWDDGEYGKIVCDGDVHTTNTFAAGFAKPSDDPAFIKEMRNNKAKTFIYAFLYGAGDTKIGSIVDPTASETKQRKIGKKLKATFTERVHGLGQLTTAVQKAASRGYLIGLDGRHLHVRKAHAALNTLLQSAAALLSKRWMVEVDTEVKRRGWQDKVQQLIWYHDELQFEADPDIAEEFGKMAVECISRAGDYFGIRVPLTGEAKVGANWGECH